MSDSPEKRPPKLGFSPGGYLPRLWRVAPDPPAGSEPGPGKKKGGTGASTTKGKKKGKPTDGEDEGVKKGVLLEETPGLDTIEARRTARVIAGTVGTLLLLIVGFLVFRVVFRSSAEDEPPAVEKVTVEDIRLQKERHETEARTMIERAREVARGGNTELALSLLNRVSVAYPETKAATIAREVIGRPKQNLPLFSDSPEMAADTASPKPNQGEAKPPRPEAVKTAERPEAPAPAPAPLETTVSAPANLDPALAANQSSQVPPRPAGAPEPVEATPPSRPLPADYQARPGVGVHPSGWPLEISGGRDSAMMVLVPGGHFVMGRDGGDPAEAPAHQVKVSTFYIDKHEVTNRQFDRFVKETGPRNDRNRALVREGGAVSFAEDSPAVMVSARDAADYADWAGKRLPTEAQWEMAARGTDNRAYPWGPLPPVWERRREPRQIDPVMSFPSDSSPFGAYDLAGNALEWTRDWYDPSYYASLHGAIADDPAGPATPLPSSLVTVKGGSKHWIVTAREGIKDDSRLPYLGFRCVLPVEGPTNQAQTVAPAPAPPVQLPAPSPPVQRVPRKKVFVPF